MKMNYIKNLIYLILPLIIISCDTKKEIPVLNSTQRLEFYKKVLGEYDKFKNLKDKILYIPIYETKDGGIYFVSYNNDRYPQSAIYIHINNLYKNLELFKLDKEGLVDEHFDLEYNNYSICFLPYSLEYRRFKSEYNSKLNSGTRLPESTISLYRSHLKTLESLSKERICENIKDNNENNTDISTLDNRNAITEDLRKIKNSYPKYLENKINEFFKYLNIDEIDSNLDNKLDDSKFNKVFKFRRVKNDSKVYINPYSDEQLINEKASQKLKKDIYHQIDSSCIVFEKKSDGNYSLINIYSPDWLNHVSGWVLSKDLSDNSFTPYEDFINKDYYKSFSSSADPSLYNKLKDISIKIDEIAINNSKKVIDEYINNGILDIKLIEAKVLPSSTIDDINILYITNHGNKIYSSKDSSFK